MLLLPGIWAAPAVDRIEKGPKRNFHHHPHHQHLHQYQNEYHLRHFHWINKDIIINILININLISTSSLAPWFRYFLLLCKPPLRAWWIKETTHFVEKQWTVRASRDVVASAARGTLGQHFLTPRSQLCCPLQAKVAWRQMDLLIVGQVDSTSTPKARQQKLRRFKTSKCIRAPCFSHLFRDIL